MTKNEIRVLNNVIAKLKCTKRVVDGVEHQRCSADVEAALRGPAARLYLETWVIPALEMLLPGDKRNPALAAKLSD